MNTNKFHIIPQYLLKKLDHNEKEKTYSVNINGNEEPVLSINKFYFSFNEIKPSERITKGIISNFSKLANIIEEMWNEDSFEDKINNYLENSKNKIKGGERILVLDNSLKNETRVMWSKFSQLSDDRIHSFDDGGAEEWMNFILSMASTLIEVEDNILKFKKRFYREINNKKVISIIKEIILNFENLNKINKPHILHKRAISLDGDENEVLAFLYKHEQPLRSVPYGRVPVELIDNRFKWLAPYGYEFYQLNKKTTLITINTINTITKHTKIKQAFVKMEKEEFDEILRYFYFNSYVVSNEKIYSSSIEKIQLFKNEIRDFKKENYNKNLMLETMKEYNDYLSDFNISSTVRNENFYMPLENSFNRIESHLNNEEIEKCFIASKTLPPANFFNKKKTIELKELFDDFYRSKITIDEFNKVVDHWYSLCIFNIEKILKIEVEDYLNMIVRKG